MNKILVIDIETRPAAVYVWGLFNQNISLNQIIQPSSIICFAAKFVGDPEVHFYSEWEHGQKGMLKAAHKLLSEADAVVGYNSESFDLRKLQGEFLLCGFDPPPPPTNIDLLKTVRKLGFQSSKLAFVGPFLKIGRKVKHAGFELWTGVMAGDKKSQDKMRKYNIGDVYLTEQLYKRLKPFIKDHPHTGAKTGGACGSCQSEKLQSRGYRYTKSFKIQRLQCTACGSWQDGKREKL